ncbi:elongation factor P 5-aminopentanone reductase [Planococcus lenghuensis]|uniref:3-ketoacyl-ACP synthase n=1 Tax=Planococcus lenghuensis TaxID=2213202 RepID=A0A1Q2KZS2_9BACL|nr:SDR family oxidoreductase [Planococcus lenghuensis]AQQ53700.1 3-ketoacyl-ACP synthase [Planococcus lenghuensis]
MKRFAVIMGASGDVGAAVAASLAKTGWSLYLHWHSRFPATLLKELTEQYPAQEFIPVQANFKSPAGGRELADQIYDAACIVVASGQSHFGLLADTDEQELDALWQVHVKNPVQAIRRLSRFFHRHDKSYVVFISSIWGETGAAMETAYSTVKGAQLAFTKAYAKEMASVGTRVNALAPGLIRTKMNEQFNTEELDELEREIPLGIGTAQDVAAAVDYLTGGTADYVTGQVLRVNGGWYM